MAHWQWRQPALVRPSPTVVRQSANIGESRPANAWPQRDREHAVDLEATSAGKPGSLVQSREAASEGVPTAPEARSADGDFGLRVYRDW
jgi:hypothetical protein